MSELTKKTDQELAQMLASSREQVRDLRFKVASRQLKDLRQIRAARKDVARIMTYARQRKHAEAKPHAEAQAPAQDSSKKAD